MRSAPSQGYDFYGVKRQYRRAAWAALRRHAYLPMAEARCLLMPSSEGTEIEVALNNGAREYNLVIVDRNAAIIARLKRKYSRVTAIGVDVVRAARRLRRDGEAIDIMNLDLCGYQNHTQLRTVAGASHVLSNKAVAAITWIRGRERGILGHDLAAANDRNKARAAYTGHALSHGELFTLFISPNACGTYPESWLKTAAVRELTKPAFARIEQVAGATYQSSMPMQWGVWRRERIMQ